jgi:hypothetical protein
VTIFHACFRLRAYLVDIFTATMPEMEVKSSWADEVEDDGNHRLPEPTEIVKNGVKIVTEYKYNDDNKKVNPHCYL